MRSSKMLLGTVGALSIFIFMAGATSSMEMKQKKAEMLYEEAILKKDGEGDLTAAIKLFQQILKDFPQNRRIAGQAQLQIGLCFERFGEKEAVIAYRAVIAQYGDQASLVKLARERLSVLSKPTASNSIKGEGIILRELDMPWGYPSPDGRYVIYMGSGGNLVQFDTTSGEEKPLTDFKGCKTCWVDSMTWTPDGKQIAYIWHDSNEVCNLCLINRDGSGNRIVYGNPQKLIIDVAGWMPSGKEIVVLTETKDRKHALGIITVEDGSLKDVQDIEETPFSASLSWDGLHVAYDYRTDKNGFDINVFSFDRGETSSIINHPGNDHVLGWALKGSPMYLIRWLPAFRPAILNAWSWPAAWP